MCCDRDSGRLERRRRRELARSAPAEDPLAPYQRLTRGDGGVRVHNGGDLARLLQILDPIYAANTIVLTALGDPARSTP